MMSNMPLVPPILPLPNEDVNAPEPESENAEKREAERMERIEDGDDLLDPDPREPGGIGPATPDVDTVDAEIKAAKKRRRGD